MNDSLVFATQAKNALESLKAQDIAVINVAHLTTVTDYFIVASGTSERHIRSLAKRVEEQMRELNLKPIGEETEGGWILLDYDEIVIHIMLPDTRDYYQLEKLWGVPEHVDEAIA